MASKKGKDNYNKILAALAVVFFLGSLFLTQHDMYISPDETANAFFINSFADNGSFRVQENLSSLYDNAIHPRSMRVEGGSLVPGSFTGLPFLYGMIVFIFGLWILPALTPLIAIAAVFCWHKILRSWFSKEVAFIAAVATLFHPALWYYSVRGLMHNVLFISLLVIAVYLFFERPFGKHLKKCQDRIGRLSIFQKDIDLVFAGALLSLSLFVRLSEAYWVIALMAVLVCIKWKQIKTKGLIILIFSFVIAALPMFCLNSATYGSPFVIGYNLPEVSILVLPEVSSAEQTGLIFPFGIHLRSALRHIEGYAVSLFWWLTIMATLGLPLFLQKQKTQKLNRGYFKIFLGLSIWLGVWYGSWTFFDNPDRSQITIANSYVRYWLPLYIMSTPFIASFIVWVSEKAKTEFTKKSVLAIFIILLMGMSINIVFLNGPDSFQNMSKTLTESVQIKDDVLSLTETDSIIIVDRADKIFFPDRKVMQPLRSERTFLLMPIILENRSLYYYGITLPEADMDHLNNGRLKESSLQIELIKTYSAESLYKITSK